MSTNYADINRENKIADRVAMYKRMGIRPEHMVSSLMNEFGIVSDAACNYIARFAQR